MTFTGVRCDGYGKVKGETNNWFVLFFRPHTEKYGIGCLTLIGRDAQYSTPDMNENFDLCGESCVAKKVSELLPGLHK